MSVTVVRRRPCANDYNPLIVDIVEVYMLPADDTLAGRPESAALERLQSEHPGCVFVYR